MTAHLARSASTRTTRARLARFWAGVLGWELADDPVTASRSCRATTPGSGSVSLPTEEPKTGPNQMHFDLTSTSLEDQQQTVARALELGGRHIDVGQLPEEGHVVLADPEGNEFCVIEPGNNFLADCGFIGALACDGSQEVGLLLERGAGVAAGLGPGPGDRDPVAARRHEDHLGWSAGGAEDGQEPAALRPRATGRR